MLSFLSILSADQLAKKEQLAEIMMLTPYLSIKQIIENVLKV